MRSNYYAIVPIELFTRSATSDAIRNAGALFQEDSAGLFGRDLSGIGRGIAIYAIAKEHSIDGLGVLDVHIALTDTALCFVFSRAINIQPDIGSTERLAVVAGLLRERRALHEHLLSSGRSIITSTIGLITPEIAYDQHSYVFSFFVFEDMSSAQFVRWDSQLKLLAEPSRVGLAAGEQAGLPESAIDPDALAASTYDITDVDISVNSCAYVTWASIAAAPWGNEEQARRTKDMILSLEITLQAAWNKSDALSRRIDQAINDEASDVDAEGLLIGFSQALEVIRGVVSATIPSRDQLFFDALRRTSRIDEKIEVVGRKLDLMERYVERRRELSRRNLSQFAKIALYVIGTADVLGTVLSLFTGDADLTWRFISFGAAFALAIVLGLAFWSWDRRAARSGTRWF